MEEGKSLIFTIDHVSQEYGAKVAGKKIDANIAYFREGIKPLVLNATNSLVMRNLTGSCFVENWKGVTVQLYIDKTAKLKGEVVGGVRINPNKVAARLNVTPDNPVAWDRAKAVFRKDGKFDAILAKADISIENRQKIMEECKDA
jgi:hypothetical protein